MWHSEYISITLHGSPDYFYFSPVIHPQWSSSASNRGVAPSSCHFPPSLQTSINLFMCFVCLILRAQVYFYFPTNDFTSPVPPPNSPQIGQLITAKVSHEQQTVPAIHIAMYVCNRKRDFFFFSFFFYIGRQQELRLLFDSAIMSEHCTNDIYISPVVWKNTRLFFWVQS